MVLTKGVEIIAKRDKVTYATNVTGKWVDYSIETEFGKRVKETFDLVRISPTKDNPELMKKAADNLRIMLNSEFISTESLKPIVDLFSNDTTKIEGNVVVTAGINHRTDRQLFISTFQDCDEYSISVVPTIMTRERAERMIKYVTEDIQEKAKMSKVKIEAKIPSFKIVAAEILPELLKRGKE